jgi:hypothetical protein
LVRNYGNTAAKQWLIDELYENLCTTENDLDVWEAIWEGTWPSARHYAETILKRCDAYEEEKSRERAAP